MKIFKLLIIISFLLLPAMAFAWGPLTHIYLANELFSLGFTAARRHYSK